MFPECLRYRDGAETEQHFLHRTINGLQISSERQSNRCQQVGMEIVTDPRAARQYVLWCLHAEGMTERWLTKGRSETSRVLRLYKIRLTKYDRKHDHCYRSMHAAKVSGIWSELWRFSNSLHSSDFVLPSFRPCKKKELFSVLFSEILWSEGRFFYFYYFLFSSRSFGAKIQ